MQEITNITLERLNSITYNAHDIKNIKEYEKMIETKSANVCLVLFPSNSGTMSNFNKMMNYLIHYTNTEKIEFKHMYQDINIFNEIIVPYNSNYNKELINIEMYNYISYDMTGCYANWLYFKDDSWRKRYNELFTKYIKFTPTFMKEYEPYETQIQAIKQSKKIISILIRHPALSNEQIFGVMPSFDQYDVMIKSLLDKYNNNCAFIFCTAVIEAEQYFKSKYSSYEIIHPYSLKTSNQSEHEAHNTCTNKYETARAAFLAVLLMSKGDDFIFPNSNMASVVLYINPFIQPHFLIGGI